MNLHESAENYLETILVLSKTLPVVRSVDIAGELGFKKSSVSVAMKNLRENGCITVTNAGFIYLTDTGREIAEKIYERHEFLSGWLQQLGVDEKTAAEDACKIELCCNQKICQRTSINMLLQRRVSHAARNAVTAQGFACCQKCCHSTGFRI